MSNPRNGHDPNTVPADERDWIGEVARMLKRETMLLPEYGHVEALYHELVPLQAIVAMQNRGLIALLLQVGQPGFVVDRKVIQKIEAAGLDLTVKREPGGGSITITILRPAPAAPASTPKG